MEDAALLCLQLLHISSLVTYRDTGFPKAYLILDYWTMSFAKMYLCAVNEYQDQ